MGHKAHKRYTQAEKGYVSNFTIKHRRYNICTRGVQKTNKLKKSGKTNRIVAKFSVQFQFGLGLILSF